MHSTAVLGILIKPVQSVKKKNPGNLDNDYSLPQYKIEQGLEGLPWVTASCTLACPGIT